MYFIYSYTVDFFIVIILKDHIFTTHVLIDHLR